MFSDGCRVLVGGFTLVFLGESNAGSGGVVLCDVGGGLHGVLLGIPGWQGFAWDGGPSLLPWLLVPHSHLCLALRLRSLLGIRQRVLGYLDLRAQCGHLRVSGRP